MQNGIIPLFGSDGRQQVSDDLLRAAWRRIVDEGKVETLFYAGGINTPAEFLEFVKSPQRRVSIVVDEGGAARVVGWLTKAEDGSAFAHYCVLGRLRRGDGLALRDFWSSQLGADGLPLLRLLLGITPEINSAALRLLGIMGFTTLGTIPQYCYCPYAGVRCGGVISYYECQPAAGRPDES